jgi:hypothetical protein
MTLKEKYTAVCNEYLGVFQKKQSIVFDGWIGDEIGGICCFGDYFINFSDVVLDIDSEQPKELILKWQNDSIDWHLKGRTEYINYKSYAMGIRFEDL